MRPIREVLSNEGLIGFLFEESISKALSLIKFPDKSLTQTVQTNRFEAYEKLFYKAMQLTDFEDWVKRMLQEKVEDKEQEWYSKAAMDVKLNRKHSQFNKALLNTLKTHFAKQLAGFFFVGEQ